MDYYLIFFAASYFYRMAQAFKNCEGVASTTRRKSYALTPILSESKSY